MSCSPFDLKDFYFGELPEQEGSAVERHVAACAACHEELAALSSTHAVLRRLHEEEPPRRLAFVSDRVFEPRWWQGLWHAPSRLGFVSALMLAVAILFHAVYPAPEATNQAVIEAAVRKAVAESETRQVEAVEAYVSYIQKRLSTLQRASYETGVRP